MSLEEGFGVGFRWVVGGGLFLWKRREKGKEVGRVGGGVGTGKGTGKSMRKLCRNYPSANYPLVSPLGSYESKALRLVYLVSCVPIGTVCNGAGPIC